MVVKVYVSGISGNKEVKKRQQRVLMILDSKSIKYDVIDITEPGKESDKEFMQTNSKSNGGTVSDPNPRSPLPPQVFNDDEYCGDYDQFDLANEVDTLEQFLKMEAPPEEPPQVENEQEKVVNGDVEAESKETEASTEEKVDSTDTAEAGDDKEKTPEKESSPAKETSPTRDAKSKEGTPAKDEGAKGDSKEKSPEKETERQKSVDKEGTPKAKEGTPEAKEGTPEAKEGTPEAKEGTPEAKEGTPEGKAQSPEKETEIEAKQASKENSPAKDEVNENGTASSREQSAEKETPANEPTETAEVKKDNPSEALIQSEQVAAAE